MSNKHKKIKSIIYLYLAILTMLAISLLIADVMLNSSVVKSTHFYIKYFALIAAPLFCIHKIKIMDKNKVVNFQFKATWRKGTFLFYFITSLVFCFIGLIYAFFEALVYENIQANHIVSHSIMLGACAFMYIANSIFEKSNKTEKNNIDSKDEK